MPTIHIITGDGLVGEIAQHDFANGLSGNWPDWLDEPTGRPSQKRKATRELVRSFKRHNCDAILETNDDFVIREINLLIMLDNATLERRSQIAEYGYLYNPNDPATDDSLNVANVRMYVSADGKLEELKADAYGFSVEHINEQVRDQNYIQDLLAYDINPDSH